MPDRKGRVRMALLLFVIVAGFYWKITLTRQFDWVWGPDLATQVMPWFEEQARGWRLGSIPLWDPYTWAGQPLPGQAQPGTAYPLNWLLFSLPLRGDQIRWWAVQWYFVIIHFMAVFFAYLLCRELGRSRTASVLGGIVFGLAGYVGTTGWPQMVNGALWFPLVLLFLLRAGRGVNVTANAALSGLFLGIAWLSGHHQAPFFLTLATAGVWLYFIFRSGRIDWRFARAAAIAMVLMGLTGALQILPAYEYGHLAKRWVGAPDALNWNQPVPYSVHEQFDLKPFNLLGIVFPDVKAGLTDPFVGVTALALALLGIAMCWRETAVRILGAVAVGGLLYALGHYSVFQGFLYGAVPELDKARVVSAAVTLFQCGVAALAAFGVDQLSAPEAAVWTGRITRGVFIFAVFTLALFQFLLFNNKMTFPGPDTAMLTPFLALGLAAILFATLRGGLNWRQAGALIILLALFEIGNTTWIVFAPRADANRAKWLDQMRANRDVAAFVKSQPGFYRAEVANDAFSANWGAWHGVEMWGGQLASVTNNMVSFEFWKFQSRMLYGVAYTIAPAPTPEGGQEVFAGHDGMKVYRHPEVFPRAWPVHRLLRVGSADEGNRLVQEHLADFHDMAYLQTAPPSVDACGSPDQVDLREHSPNSVRIHARMACRGMVVLSDTFFPGWHASIDGQSTPIYEVNAAMRGVVVPAGDHTVTLQYRPASVIAGFVLSLFGVAGAIVLARRKESLRTSTLNYEHSASKE